jgi:multiple antibiotic resistance protein
MTALAFGVLCFSSLLTVIDPIAVAPLFVSMNSEVDARERRRRAIRACVAALAILILFASAGSLVLRIFGLTIEAFRIAGGVLFGVLAMSMLSGDASGGLVPKGSDAADPSIVPLGIPLIGGPGAITTVMVLGGQSSSSAHAFALALALLLVIVVTALVLAAAPRLVRRLGPSGVQLVTRLMGLLMLVLGVQFVIDGIRPIAAEILRGAG